MKKSLKLISTRASLLTEQSSCSLLARISIPSYSVPLHYGKFQKSFKSCLRNSCHSKEGVQDQRCLPPYPLLKSHLWPTPEESSGQMSCTLSQCPSGPICVSGASLPKKINLQLAREEEIMWELTVGQWFSKKPESCWLGNAGDIWAGAGKQAHWAVFSWYTCLLIPDRASPWGVAQPCVLCTKKPRY